MRFRNLSNIKLDRVFWRELARPLGLHAALKGAISDDLGIYSGKSLRITIRPRQLRRKDHSAAHYTYGHISIFPCPRCRIGWLVVAYLHELVHAWLHDNDHKLYDSWNHCEFADRFADSAYLLLGGELPNDGDCGRFRFNARRARQKLPGYRRFARDLAMREGAAIMRWRAAMVAGSLTKFCS